MFVLHGRSARTVIILLYLNLNWQPEHGGQLHIFDSAGETRLLPVVEPRIGTFVAFLSEWFPHEVRPTCYERLSLSGWWPREWTA